MTYQVETRRPEKCTIVYKIKRCVTDGCIVVVSTIFMVLFRPVFW